MEQQVAVERAPLPTSLTPLANALEPEDPLELKLRRRGRVRMRTPLILASVVALAAAVITLSARAPQYEPTDTTESEAPVATAAAAPQPAMPGATETASMQAVAPEPPAKAVAEQQAEVLSEVADVSEDDSEEVTDRQGERSARARREAAASQERASRRAAARESRERERVAGAEPATTADQPVLRVRRKREDGAGELTRAATDAMLRGQLTQAATLYSRALDADATHAGALRGYGLVLQQLGKTREAAAAYRRYLKVAPHSSAASKIRERLADLAP
jgi:tetratricopeptide (TPR) repeat protein